MRSPAVLWRDNRLIAYQIANTHYLPGADREDVEQECLIALWEAAKTWDGRGRFVGYASMVVKRHMIDAMRTANTLKHRLLTESARTQELEDAEVAIAGMLADERYCPVRIAEAREDLARIQEAMRTLFPSEREAIAALVNDEPQTKRGLNARWSARQKLQAALAS